MANRLFLLDGMALAYRAHFAFLQRPIRTSKGINTSALYGFTTTLLELIEEQSPTHIAVVFDTPAPTARHREFPEYKAQREAMPEELAFAIPNLFRLCEALRIPALKLDGYEADDLIGTLVHRAEKEGFSCWMVTPDKDFGQLVTDHCKIFKPSKGTVSHEILGVQEVCEKWGVQRPTQVIDILALWGDASDNIPGVPGIGEKTASKLISQFGSLEELLARTAELKDKLRQSLEANSEQARLCKRLATIQLDVPIDISLDELKLQSPNLDAWRAFCDEFEFSSLGRRLLGQDYKVRAAAPVPPAPAPVKSVPDRQAGSDAAGQLDLFSTDSPPENAAQVGTNAAATQEVVESTPPTSAGTSGNPLRTLRDIPHRYLIADTAEAREQLLGQLREQTEFCFDTETTGLDPLESELVGVSFAWKAGEGWYLPVPSGREEALRVLSPFRSVFEDPQKGKIGHNLKFDVRMLMELGIEVRSPLFDTMIVHALIEPELRHGMDYLSGLLLGYSPIPISALIGEKGETSMRDVPIGQVAEYATEDADVTWQLAQILRPQLADKGVARVYWEAEAPLIVVLARMEKEGVRMDPSAMADFSMQLSRHMEKQETRIRELAAGDFNLNSPKQLGEVLFDRLKLSDKPRKTRTGQYATNEEVLQELAPQHEIVRCILDYRTAAKLKNTYADSLPGMIAKRTGRIHTTYQQALAVTGRLSSHDPNLQNIPIRTELGQEIRRAFVPRQEGFRLLSADYSQIELRIIAALSQDPTMLAAFASGVDIHAATAAGIFGTDAAQVTPEMRRRAKMVNFGIAYGISAFGLAQRLGIPRGEASAIIDQYFKRFPGIRGYIDRTLEFAREKGYVETLLGRRRMLPDVRSGNAAVRGAAERNAINMPVQGTAADMIKLAMIRIDREFELRRFRSRMILQIHDELLFDLHPGEEEEVRTVVVSEMKQALPIATSIEVDVGVGLTWLEAHA